MLYISLSESLGRESDVRDVPSYDRRPLAAYEVVQLLQRSICKGDAIISDALEYLEYFSEVSCSDYESMAEFLQAVKHRLKETGDWVCWPLAQLFGRPRMSGLRDILRQRRLTLIDVGHALGLSGWRAVGAVWLWDLVGIPKRHLREVAQVLNVSADTLLQAEKADVCPCRLHV